VLLLTMLTVHAFAQQTLTGTVRDASGPLPGVSVSVKGTSKVTQTSSAGKFSISVNPGEVIAFSAVGFARQEVTVGNQTSLDITMKDSENKLNEVVVTSLGIKKQQKSLGYAVSTITAKDITEAGNTNFASALYGKAAGVKITTAPGGSSSAVNVQIRGINSLNFNRQPVYVIDGVMVRNDQQNGANGANNNNYWDDQRIRGNGVLDINPEDIESLTVLKGASASALYGSDAASGVIVITTKKGIKDKGLGIDFNYAGTVEKVAFLPKYQNVYGPGYDRETNLGAGATADGWLKDNQPNSPTGYRPWFSAWANFGPKMEGQQVRWWDGSIRSFSPQPNNYKEIYDTGYSSNANLSISNQTEKVNYRLSATRLDYKGISPGSKQQKNTFSLNSNVKLSSKLNVDLVANYVNTLTHNRPYLFSQVLGSYSGFINRSEDMNLLREKYQTADGYKYATLNSGKPNSFIYNLSGVNLMDVFWNQLKNQYDETENRLITSATLNYDIVNHLKFRGRIGNDFTSSGIEDKRFSEYASTYNSSSSSTGAYNTSKGNYSITYGDALLTYNNKVGSDFDYSVSGGFQSRTEKYKDQNSYTKDGLVTENWFSLNNSYGVPTTSATRREMMKYAYLGILNLSYKNYLFLEGTARQEYTSTLPSGNNSYFYPSVNTGFVFSDAFKMPEFFSYGKLRASYGEVANDAPMYRSNIVYKQKPLNTINGAVPQLTFDDAYGNLELKPERKREFEFGTELKFLSNRLGLDISYYTNTIKDQILPLTTAPSVGSTSQLVNAGKIGNHGVEIALNATPVIAGDFKWDTRINFAFNKSKVISLADGIPNIVFIKQEQDAILLQAGAGEQLGNISVYPRATDNKGNYLIDDNGLYIMDKSKHVIAGNIMPKALGGFSNTFSYKNFSVDFMIDYRFGGQMISPQAKYAIGAGLYESTLQYRDAEHGGLTYTDGGVTYHDGVLLPGVNATTGAANTKVIDAANYYINTYQWGADGLNDKGGAIFDNSYIKLREAVVSYKLPNSISSKMHLNNLKISLIGRNLFYFWKTYKYGDPEAPVGNQWYSQGLDVGSSASTRSFGFSLNANF
jgi:iron complex outermembrane receptor protein